MATEEKTTALPEGWPAESGQRLEKARALRALGVPLYPTCFERTHRLSEVVAAHGGRALEELEALKKMMLKRPTLLITDIMMPEMDGYELVSSVRKDDQLADVPVIMLTARTQDNDVTQGYTSGTDLYLTKPFNPIELIRFVQRILG